MCDLVQSKYLTSQEFVTVVKAQSVKYGFSWGMEHERVVEELLGRQGVTESKFVEAFCCNGGNGQKEVEE